MHDELDYYAAPAALSARARPRLWGWFGLLQVWRHKSASASSEWLAYYKGLYTTHSPDPEMFSVLLQRNGMWALPNPFREGHEDFYKYHPDGVCLADMDFIIARWLRRTSTPVPDAIPSSHFSSKLSALYEHRLDHAWSKRLSVEENERHNEAVWEAEQICWHRDAIRSLACLFEGDRKNWQWIKTVMHSDNIKIVLRDVYIHIAPSRRDRLWSAWSDAQWVDPRHRPHFDAALPKSMFAETVFSENTSQP